MIRRITILVLVMTILLSFSGCGLKRELYEQTKNFYDIVNGTIPGDLRLTIYYLNGDIETIIPLNIEMLKSNDGIQVISVGYEDLVKHKDHLKKFDTSSLKPIYGKTYVNARLYYVFEVGDSGPILEYVHSWTGCEGADYLNGIAIQLDLELIDLISPFLPEDSVYKDYPRSLVKRQTN